MRRVASVVLALLFVAAGVNHFVSPEPYVAIVPSFLPRADLLVVISGVAEVLGGVGLLFRATRRVAAVGLIALLVAVFPANVFAALNGMSVGGWVVPEWLLWVRLPLQGVLIWWVYFAGMRKSSPGARTRK